MKKIALIILPAFLATPLLAQASLVDADGNGTYSFTEITAAYPEVSEDAFLEMDTNGDGELDADEVAAAQDAGLLASDG
ncbi:EF hand [Lutimaribacter pacificus]|uniref:EF hand n=1 Tax=Lutimaribacter pacificus TaxID=391948 RepID=A0A1H0LRM0_9RHOB|nr:EF-hand domain-containing protein [Lutimaribacter pacificus]SDO70691.1 EF hand [Lutimaribacter pacificus]SHK04283.1 EF hand [Lutimaribacter pacificus]